MHDAHTESLRSKHAFLDAKIQEEAVRPHPDAIYMTTLKKQKLRIKEELAGLTAHAAG